jgi:signal transduction histidine kinase
MPWPSLVYLSLTVVAFVTTVILVAYAWRHRDIPSAETFAGMMLVVAVMLGSMALGNLSAQKTAPFWFRMRFSTMALLPMFFISFALQYGGLGRLLTRGRAAVLFLLPTVTLVLTWVPQLRPLFIGEFRYSSANGLLWVAGWDQGPWYWVHTVYSYTLLLLALVLVVIMAIRTFYRYRTRAVALFAAAAVPIANNILTTFHLWDFAPNLTPLSYTVTGVIFAWAIFRHQLLEVVPIARNTLVDMMGDAMLVVDAQGCVADLNPAMLRLLAAAHGPHGVDRVVGLPAGQLLAPWPTLLQSLQDNREARREVDLVQEGKRRYLDVLISPLVHARGRLAGHLVVWHDVTERKESEEALRLYTAELEASNAELDAFAHTVAHDLKNPLASLVGFGMLMEQRFSRMDAEQVQTSLAMMVQSGHKMTQIIDELLLLATVRKMEQVETGPLDMSAIVSEALKRLTEQVAVRNAEIITAERWPQAVGYAPWIEEVWANYISNALKYGGTPPRVELGADVEEEAFVRFWVRDNGPGLLPEQQGQIFTEFTRLHQTRAQGHGLGLSIVQRIVERLGGRVGVESQEGHGSTFYFTLPGR